MVVCPILSSNFYHPVVTSLNIFTAVTNVPFKPDFFKKCLVIRDTISQANFSQITVFQLRMMQDFEHLS